MKILLVSMPSVHVLRWIENLNDESHELYWFDVLNKGDLNTTVPIRQFTNWKKRKFPYFKGEHFLSKRFPSLYEKVIPFLEITANEQLEAILQEIQPDVVHSFEMQSCSYPILKTMQHFPLINWIYSCWGSDLYFYQNDKEHLSKIKDVLKRINYLHTDCDRDYQIAKLLGFSGTHLGVIPGGGGFHLEALEKFKKPIEERNIILVKGYQHNVGRGLNIIKSLETLQSEIAVKGFKVVVFGAHNQVQEYIKNAELPFEVFDRHGLTHEMLLNIMGKSIIYIGNSISDGMPNTLLEAIIMGVFPIQSNPGGVTAEIITDGKNGLLISDPENVNEIKSLILQAINSKEMIEEAFIVNAKLAKEKMDYESNNNKIAGIYLKLNKK